MTDEKIHYLQPSAPFEHRSAMQSSIEILIEHAWQRLDRQERLVDKVIIVVVEAIAMVEEFVSALAFSAARRAVHPTRCDEDQTRRGDRN